MTKIKKNPPYGDPPWETKPWDDLWKDQAKVICLHKQCTECHGSGRKENGTMCVHMISCPCPRCTTMC